MARSRFAVARTRAPKRKTVWIGTAIQGNLSIASGASFIMSSFAPDTLSILAGTVVRVRGKILVRPQAFGADQEFNGAWGLGAVSDEAFAAGEASIPRPFDDDDWPGWIAHGYYMGHLQFQSATSELVFPIIDTIDSKAMRKIGPNTTLVWMVESNFGAVSVYLHARVLMMLS